MLDIAEGTPLVVDGTRGEVIPHPPAEVLSTFQARAAAMARHQRRAIAHAASPAATRDAVVTLADPFDPGVLSLVSAVCRGADQRVPVAVCGELAANEMATALLIGLGVRELSVAPRAVPVIKHALRNLNHHDATALAATALNAEGPDAVRELCRHPPRW